MHGGAIAGDGRTISGMSRAVALYFWTIGSSSGAIVDNSGAIAGNSWTICGSSRSVALFGWGKT